MKVKNVRPGILIIADVDVRLAPGETWETDDVSVQTRASLNAGHLVLVQDSVEDPTANPESATPNVEASTTTVEAQVTTVEPVDITKMSAHDAIIKVKTETSASTLKEWASLEHRRTVKDALSNRIQELTGAA